MTREIMVWPEGKEPAVMPRLARAKRNRKTTTPAGYADIPGTGPEGETCRSCRHLYRKHMAKTYLKCALMRPYWTGGGKTDILARSPACRKWEPK